MASYSSRRQVRQFFEGQEPEGWGSILGDIDVNFFKKVILTKEVDGIVFFHCEFKDGSKDWLCLSDFQQVPSAVMAAHDDWRREKKRRVNNKNKSKRIRPISKDVDVVDDEKDEAELLFRPPENRVEEKVTIHKKKRRIQIEEEEEEKVEKIEVKELQQSNEMDDLRKETNHLRQVIKRMEENEIRSLTEIKRQRGLIAAMDRHVNKLIKEKDELLSEKNKLLTEKGEFLERIRKEAQLRQKATALEILKRQQEIDTMDKELEAAISRDLLAFDDDILASISRSGKD